VAQKQTIVWTDLKRLTGSA